jgi:hypothetical protein
MASGGLWIYHVRDIAVVASYGNHLLLVHGQSVQALPCIGEIIPFDKDLLFPEPVQCIPHRS